MTTYAGVVLAAGSGTRMNSRTPKVLHQICGRAMVRLSLDAARDALLHPIVLVVPQDASRIKAVLGESALYATQAEPLGTGNALLQAHTALHNISGIDNILVLYGDAPLIKPHTLKQMMAQHDESNASVTILTAISTNPHDMGRILRNDAGNITEIVEHEYADDKTLAINEVNCGFYCFQADWLWKTLANLPPSPKGEIFLTDIVQAAASQGLPIASITVSDAQEAMGVNNRIQLAEAEAVMRRRIRERWMLAGVTMPDPSSVYIDHDVTLGQDTTILPNTHIIGNTAIGSGCRIGPNSVISDARIGDNSSVMCSVVRDSTLGRDVDVGPFSHIRGGCHIEDSVHIGTSAELKNSRLGQHTKVGHFSYTGDATLGARVNIGAGTITCNFDGSEKHETTIGDDAFIGSDTKLVAPVNVGAGAATGAGAVVTRDVPPGSLVVGVPARKMPAKRNL